MKLAKILFSVPLILLLGCKEKTNKQNSKLTTAIADTAIIDKTQLLANMNGKSFVLSCGGGCAMSYTAKQIAGNSTIIKVKFLVDVFENEEEVDNYFEHFIFYYNNSYKLVKIMRDCEKESFLQTQMPSAQTSFKNFASQLILIVNKSC